jgi:hypothetical protein
MIEAKTILIGSLGLDAVRWRIMQVKGREVLRPIEATET